MQSLFLFNDGQIFIQSNDKIYQDTIDNFLLDLKEDIPQMEVDGKSQIINKIDYNQYSASCWLNGKAFQPYPNEFCEKVLTGIDTLLENQIARSYQILTLTDYKNMKMIELKEIRDTREQSPLDYEDNSYDYDLKSVTKLNEARDKLIKKGGDQVWITATNTIVYLTLDDIDGIKLAGADRSNSLHIKYAQLREYVNSLESVDDVNAVTFDMSLPETELVKE